MGTRSKPGKLFGCYAAPDTDEPIFVLLGRDRHAPTLVRLWADMRERADESPENVAKARQCADTMDAWREHGSRSKR